MKTLEEATLEEILADVSGSECIDSALLVMSDDDGKGVYLCDYEGRGETTAPTLREALILFKSKTVEKYGFEEDESLLDWSRFTDKG